jgi:hypothetical protein
MRRFLRYIYRWQQREGRHAPGAWMRGERWLIDYMSVRPDYLGGRDYGIRTPAEPLPPPGPPEFVRMYVIDAPGDAVGSGEPPTIEREGLACGNALRPIRLVVG